MYSAPEVDELFEKWKKEGCTKEQLIIKTGEAELGWPYVWGAVAAQCMPSKREYYANRSSCPEAEAKLIISGCQALNGSGKSCGGCTYYPNNMRTLIDDCQGFVKQLCSRVGISLAGGGCTSMWNNDNNWTEKGQKSQMPKDKVCLVFQRDPSDPQKMQHVGLHVRDDVIIECATTVRYNNATKSAWTHYAMVKGLGGSTPMPTHATIRRGSTGPDVVECQQDLISLGYDLSPYGADGKFGAKTETAVKQFQSTHVDPNTGKQLKADGIVGPATWAALDAAVTPGTDLYTVTIHDLTYDQAQEIVSKYGGSITKEGASN